MSSSARLIATALRDSPQAASLIARFEATQRAALAIAPACRLVAGIDALQPGVCELRGETLWISLPSPSHSAKLRQATPRLLSTLAADGFKVYEIKTRVQPAVTSYPGDGSPEPSSHSSSPSRGLPWPPSGEKAAASVTALAESVGESPLKDAVGRLAATLRKRAPR